MADEVPLITDAAELDSILAQGADMDDDGKVKDPAGKQPAKPAGKPADQGQPPKGDDDLPDNDGNDDKDDEGDDKDKVEDFDNVIAYLNKVHDLGLNVEELPKDLTREDEAELVSTMFQRVVDATENRIRQYEEVQNLLQDEEVVELLKAKAEGKSLKDLYGKFSTTPDGMSDEQLVFDDFRKRYPKLPDASINEMIAAQKEKGKFSEFATAVREQRKEEDKFNEQENLKREQLRVEQAKAQQQAEDAEFTTLVKKVKKINEVNFTEDMQAEVIKFALQRDKDGMSQLDHALQSNVGALRATLGIFLLERLMGAKATVKTNEHNKTLMEKLFRTPSQAGSGGGNANRSEEIPDEVYNRF